MRETFLCPLELEGPHDLVHAIAEGGSAIYLAFDGAQVFR